MEGKAVMLNYKKFDADIVSSYVENLLNNGNIFEIIRFLENEYQHIGISFDLSDKIDFEFELNEKRLIDLNNDLINKYLVQYCKAKNTYYYLLEIDNALIHQAVFNLNMAPNYDKRFIKYLVSDDKAVKLINYFFHFYIENYKNSIGHGRNAKSSYIDALIEKRDAFSELSEDQYIKILQNVLTEPKIKDILQKEVEEHNNWMTNKTEIQKNIWNLICNLDVNIETVRLLSWMSEFICGNIDSFFCKNYNKIEEQLKRWSNFEYKEPINNYDYYSNGDDYDDRTRIQMLICSYVKSFDELKKLEYDGAKAYIYQYKGWWGLVDSFDGGIDDYINFFETYGKRKEGAYIDNLFKYFELNVINYQEKYFKTFINYCSPDSKLVLENFQNIGSGILAYDDWDIERLFERNNLNDEQQKYYLMLYNKQKDKSEILEAIAKLPKQNEYNELLREITILENKIKEKQFWLYILLICIFLYQIFFK